MRTPYFTDLNDNQWQMIRAEVFHDSPESSGYRDIVNTLRYREHTALSWELLPPGLCDHEAAQAREKEWVQGDIWPGIHAVLARHHQPAPMKQVPSLLDRLRLLKRMVGTTIRSLPGGFFLTLPIRTGLFGLRELKQYLRKRNAPAGPTIDDLVSQAQKAFLGKDFEKAILLNTNILEKNPHHHEALIKRCWANHEAGHLEAACADGWSFLALPVHPDYSRQGALNTLSQIMMSKEDRERAILFKYQSKLDNCHRPTLQEVIDRDGREKHSKWVEAIMETYDEYAEEAVNHYCDFEVAMDVYRRKSALMQQYTQTRKIVDEETLLISPDWVRNIGHMAYIDFLIKMARLQWQPWKKFVVLAPLRKTANDWYLKYLSAYASVIADPSFCDSIKHLLITTGAHRVAGRILFPDGSDKYFCEGMGLIQESWETNLNPPLLQLTAEDQEYRSTILKKYGLTENDWFVCLHVRSAGYHKEGNNQHQSHRNADIFSYLSAIKEITRQGGWVIRMGDPSMPPLPPMERVIDYAHAPDRSQRMDVILCASCRFFIGVASGLLHVPTSFGTPCLATNWISNHLPVYSKSDLFIPKLIWSTQLRRPLTFAEMFRPEIRKLSYAGAFLYKNGLTPIDNTDDEIRDAVADMIKRVNDSDAHSYENDKNWSAFKAISHNNGLAGFSRIGYQFLGKHCNLVLDRSDTSFRVVGKAA